ncbi:MAG TPA: hypothetical protein VI386_22645 [Candidatus Sulfotelmatobacter sp.]
MSVVRADPHGVVITDNSGNTLDVVTSAPSAGQTGLVVYAVGGSAVTQTQDAADGPIGSAIPADAILIGGKDGSGNLQAVTLTSGGVKTDGSAVTQPVSASSLPLPTGAATAALQGTVLSDAPAGTESAAVVRTINRKRTAVETNTPLAANATYTGAWHDSELDGTVYVIATSLSNVAATAGSFVIQLSDDTSNASLTYNSEAGAISPQANTRIVFPAYIRSRYWRVVYQNGATLQTTFEITTCSFSTWMGSYSTGIGATSAIGQVVVNPVNGAGLIVDNNVNTPGCTLIPQNGATGPLVVTPMIYGGAFGGSADAARQGASKQRTPTVFKQASITSASSTNKVAIWTPGTSNKFRLLKLKIVVSGGVIIGSAQEVTLTMYDNTTAMSLVFPFWVPTAGTGTATSFDVDLGLFGILSAAANNALQVALGTAITGGTISVISMGTEE